MGGTKPKLILLTYEKSLSSHLNLAPFLAHRTQIRQARRVFLQTSGSQVICPHISTLNITGEAIDINNRITQQHYTPLFPLNGTWVLERPVVWYANKKTCGSQWHSLCYLLIPADRRGLLCYLRSPFRRSKAILNQVDLKFR